MLLVSSHSVAVAAGIAFAAATLGFGGLELAAIIVLVPLLILELGDHSSERA